MLTAIAAALALQAGAYEPDYQTALQCAVTASTLGLTREEPETGPMRALGGQLMTLASSLAPAEMSVEAFRADVVNTQNLLFMLTGHPSEPGFEAQMEAMAPEVERCRALVD